MTCGRLTWVSSSSSARSRASPSGVRASAATTGAGGAASDGGRGAGLRRSRCTRRRRTAFRRGRFAASALGVTVGHADDTCRGQRRRDRLGDQRAGQPGRLALARRAAQVRPREDDAAVGEGSQVRLGNAGGEGRQQGVLVFLGRRGRRPPDLQPIERAQCLEPMPAGRRSPVAELRLGDRGHPPRHGHLGRPDEEDRLRRQPERPETGGHGFRRRHLAVEAERLDPFDPLADAGQLDRGRRQRGGRLDDEDPRSLGLDRTPPDRWAVGHEADRTKE